MNAFRSPFVKQQFAPVFFLSLFLINTWSIINMFWHFPFWIFRMDVFDLLGAASYLLLFAFLEAAVLSFAAILLGYLLPEKWYRAHYLANGSMFVLIILILVFAFHLLRINVNPFGYRHYAVIAAGLAATIGAGILVTNRFPDLRKALTALQDRIFVPGAFYLGLDILGILIVLIRNLPFG